MTRLRHCFNDLGAIALQRIDGLVCFVASNGAPATTESAFVGDTWAAQVERAQKLAEAAEAEGKIAPHHLDGAPESDGEEEAPPEGEEQPAPKPAAKKPEAKAKKEETEDEPEDKNAGKVTPDERVNFRKEKAKWREQRDQKDAEFRKLVKEADTKYARLTEVEALFAAGDVVSAVEKLSGKKWNDVQKEAINRVKGVDPRVDKLERELQAEREAREKAEADRAEREEQEAVSRERTRWMAGLREELSDGEDEVSALATHEKLGFLDDVFEAQKREFDPDTGETISAREAAEQVISNWRSLWEDLSAVFGDRPASKAEGSRNGAAHRKGSTSAKPGGKPPTTLAQRKAAEASPKASAELSEEEWLKRNTRRLREARDE
jgi:hypothetical protein